MSGYAAIDLSKLPAPSIITELDYELVLADMIARYSAAIPALADAIALESDPVRKLLEIAAYEKVLINARVNNSAKAVMIAYASGGDLDNLAALIPLARFDGESDSDFRARVQLAPEGFSAAGPRGGYEFYAMGADAAVTDVYIDTYSPDRLGAPDPKPGDVHIYVLASADGSLPAGIEAKVLAAVNNEDVRPLTDNVQIKAPTPIAYTVDAELTLSPGPDAMAVLVAAEASVLAYTQKTLKLGGYVTRSGIIAALHVGGVVNVILSAPAADVAAEARQVPVCGGISVALSGGGGGA